MSSATSAPRLAASLLMLSRTLAVGVALGALVVLGITAASGAGAAALLEPSVLAALAASVLAAHSPSKFAARVRPAITAAAGVALSGFLATGNQFAGPGVMLALLVVSVACLSRPKRTAMISQPAALGAVAIALAGLLGGWWAVDGVVLDVSPLTSVGAVAVAVASVCARPRWGAMIALSSGGRSGREARVLISAAVATPVLATAVAGWVTLIVGEADVLPMLVAVNVALLASVAAAAGVRLVEADARRDEAERALRAACEVAGEAVPLTNALAGDLTPVADDIAGWEVASRFEPAVGQLSGDWFSVTEIAGTPHLLLIDVTGHGAGAALVASWCKHQLILALEAGAGPGEALSALESLFVGAGQIATAVVARIGPEIEMASAGHPPVMVRTATGVVELEATAPPLGVGTAGFPVHRHRVDVGDAVVAISDGIIEARNQAKQEWGLGALAKVVARYRGQASEPAAEAIFDAAKAHAHGRFRDDATVVVLTRVR
jgi:serine phosphatase RsbU (regulator of sigma subunit)